MFCAFFFCNSRITVFIKRKNDHLVSLSFLDPHDKKYCQFTGFHGPTFQTTWDKTTNRLGRTDCKTEICKKSFTEGREHARMYCLLVTRKSSCVNARGISTVAYQVIHLLPEVRYPPWPGLMGVTCGWVSPWQGYPQPGLMGVPEVGYPLARSEGLPKVGYPLARWGIPKLDLAGVPPIGPGQGTTPIWTWLGSPPQVWTDRWMDGHVSKHNLPVVPRTRSVIN